ncbi:hypothetical protein EB001_25895 [bacterium]|nr:hypothetical protein [bacterium]
MTINNTLTLIDLSAMYSKEYGIDFDCYERIDHFLGWFEKELKKRCMNMPVTFFSKVTKKPSIIRPKVLGIIEAELKIMEYKYLSDITDVKQINEIIDILLCNLYSFYEDEEDMWDRYFAEESDFEGDCVSH